MTLDEASKIVHIWGVYVEYVNGKLMHLFGVAIPESFLPFPEKTLEEAINILTEHYHDGGNNDAVKTLQSTIPLLLMYKDDEKAISELVNHFNDPSWRKVILPAFKEFQTTWIKIKGTSKTSTEDVLK